MSLQLPVHPRLAAITSVSRVSGRYLSPLASLVLFVVMFLAVVIRYDFASPTQVFLNLFVDNAYLIVLTVGMTFVILTGGIDLSVGAVVALSTVLLATTLRAGWPTPVAVGAVLLVGPLLGLLMGLVIEYFGVQPFIVTLAGMFLARGLCYVLSVDSLPIKDRAIRAFGLSYVYLYEDKFIRWTVVVAVVIACAAVYVLHEAVVRHVRSHARRVRVCGRRRRRSRWMRRVPGRMEGATRGAPRRQSERRRARPVVSRRERDIPGAHSRDRRSARDARSSQEDPRRRGALYVLHEGWLQHLCARRILPVRRRSHRRPQRAR